MKDELFDLEGTAPQDSQVEIWLWLNSMVYGRYDELVFTGIYKPTFTSLGSTNYPVLNRYGYFDGNKSI